VTILTDFADLPPHFWIEPDQAQHFICGTPRPSRQAHAMGYGTSRVTRRVGNDRAAGLLPRAALDRRAEMRAWAWIPTAHRLVLFAATAPRPCRASRGACRTLS